MKSVDCLSYKNPAYFDDADLAMKVKQLVVKSVTHSSVSHGGVSNGTSTESGIQSFQKVNAQSLPKNGAMVLAFLKAIAGSI